LPSRHTKNSKVLQRTLLAALQTLTKELILWHMAHSNQGDKEIYNGRMLLGGEIITTIIIMNSQGVLYFKVKDVSLVESEKKILTKK